MAGILLSLIGLGLAGAGIWAIWSLGSKLWRRRLSEAAQSDAKKLRQDETVG